jgi:hypothetical protein
MQHSKYCGSCNALKPLHEFSVSKATKDGRQAKCKSCSRVYQMAHKYGISEHKYKCLLEAQQGECAICGSADKGLVVDHNHTTGKVRGLLCSQCNTAIGLLGDNVGTIQRAVGYLLHD